jgi:hypothetical protein
MIYSIRRADCISSDQEAIFGDPHFPKYILKTPDPNWIYQVQRVYETYSQLQIGNIHHRPNAIAALQRRIVRALGDDGYGKFGAIEYLDMDGIFNMSLLWCRAHGMGQTGLTRIDFPRDPDIERVPSWSWMAYMGSITYLKVNYSSTDWERVTSPWAEPYHGSLGLGILAKAQAFRDITGYLPLLEARIFMDDPYTLDSQLREDDYFIILGKEQRDLIVRGDDVHYVLIVRENKHLQAQFYAERIVCERIGAGAIPAKYLSAAAVPVEVEVV